MTAQLDLGPSYAKLARAREHLDALKRETTGDISDESPYTVRFSEVDPQTGWCSVSLVPDKLQKPRLGVIFGDVIHNLRCALDYVVTALVDASQTQLATRHQFPIYIDAAMYKTQVGTADCACPKGPLRGITHGLHLIEQWQPYHTKPNPRTDFLWGIHRFSNADKHRQPLAFAPRPVGQIEIAFNGIVVEDEPGPDMPDWTPDQDIHLKRIRFNPPHAENLRVQSPISLDVCFETPAFGSEPDLSVALSSLSGVIDRASILLNTFSKL